MNQKKFVLTFTTMITDNETNFVYFSELTKEKYQKEYENIISILDKYQIQHGLLLGTKDIWCRDYMPIQIAKDRFVQFRYEPSYLKEDLHLQSDPKEVIKASQLSIKPIISNINLDGGNVVKGPKSVIITERIFTENDKIEDNDIVKQIEKLLETKVHLIPCIKNDMTGHSDGHVRYVNDQTILVNSLENELKYWKNGFKKMIKGSGLNFIELPWFEFKDKKNKDTAIGIYINYLEIGNLLLFPIFEIAGNKDEEALRVIKGAYPNHHIEPVNINEIANEGGLLNCITWSI